MANNLIVKILGDDSGLKNTLSGIGTVAQKGLGLAVKATAAVGAAMGTAAYKALQFSGELEQNLGGASAVFGEFAEELEKKANQAFKNMGLSAADYLATANKMGSLFKGAGFEAKEAMDLTSEAMQRAADVASIMGLDTSAAMESIAGAAKGNFTMMDNLGVAMNDTTLNAYALEKGLGKTTAQMTNQEKIALALEMFLDKTAYAAGNYARENETLAGALSTAGAALKNFMSGVGTTAELQDALKNASKVITENLKQIAPELGKGFVEVVRGLAPVIPEIILELLPSILDTVVVLFEETLALLPDFIAQVANAIGDAVPAIKPLTDVLAFLGQNIETVTKLLIIGATAFVTYKTAAFIVTSISTLKTAYIALTGSLTAATAAQQGMNAAAMANPYVLAATLIMTVVAALATYTPTYENAVSTTRKSLDEIQQTYDQQMESIDATLAKQDEEVVKLGVLKDQLYEYENQLNSGKLSESEAAIVKERFNQTAGEMEKILPGVTSSLYDETGAINVQRDAVDKLSVAYINLTKAKALSEAYHNRLVAAYDKRIGAFETLKAANSTLAKETELLRSELPNPNGRDADLALLNTSELNDERYAVKEASQFYYDTIAEVQSLEDDYANALKAEMAATSTWEALNTSATDTVISNSNRATDTTISNAAKQTEATEEEYEKELRDLKFKREMGIITDAEYYAKLTSYRDTYFEQGSKEWQDYTSDIAGYYESVMEDVAASQKKQLENLTKERDDFAESLQNHGSLMEDVQNPIFDDHGRVAAYVKDIKLIDFSEQTEQIKHFGDNLQQLKGKASIPKELFQEIQKMSREDGIRLTDELLSLSDDDLKTWADSYSEMIQASNDVADELYADEFADLREKFDAVWDDVPADFFTLGVESADEFSKGLTDTMIKKFAALKTSVMMGFSDFASGLQLASEQQGAGGNEYNIEINMLDSPEETTREKSRAALDEATLAAMKGGY